MSDKISLLAVGLFILLSSLFLTANVFADIIYVDVANQSGRENGTMRYPYNTISEGITAAVSADIVQVAAGTYYEFINLAPGVIVRSASGAQSTIINASNISGVVYATANTITRSTVLEGFTIRDGQTVRGGGIYCSNGASPTISNNIIIANAATHSGGGIFCDLNCAPVITNNQINDNQSPYGGGIGAYHASPVIINNGMTNNSGSSGGGIYLLDSSSLVDGNTFYLNTALSGAGIYMYQSNPIVSNNVLENNQSFQDAAGIMALSSTPVISRNTIWLNSSAAAAGGVYISDCHSAVIDHNLVINNDADTLGGGYSFLGCSNISLINETIYGNSALSGSAIANEDGQEVVVKNCIITNNSSASPIEWYYGQIIPSYNDNWNNYAGEQPFGVGSISQNPQFVNAADNDFHLTGHSPCIDAGDPASPRDPDGTRADMGAYYYNQ